MFVAMLALAGCGGGGGDTPSAAPATVGVMLTDAPTLAVDEALATITSVELIGAGGRVTLFSGVTTVDLLRLGDFAELFALSEDVPPGSYSKIRLELADLVLNRLDPATGAIVETLRPRLVGNGKIDLNPRGPFSVGPGEVLFVQIDFDMEKALKLTTTGAGGVILRPVVFVDIEPGRSSGRLARVHGRVAGVDLAARTLELCQTALASRWDGAPAGDDLAPPGRERCLAVRADAATGVFDDEGFPQDFAGLEVGERATVVGRIRGAGSSDEAARRLALDAVVIEEGPLGTFRRFAGSAVNGVDAQTSRFDLALAPGQGFGGGTTLPVQLFAESRIFDRSGEELSPGDITAGSRGLVDGVLQLGDEDLLRSPLVVLASGPPSGDPVLLGEVVFVDVPAASLIVNDGSADRCVGAATAAVFLVDDDDGLEASRGELADLRPGQRVAIFGPEGLDGCVVAGTIIAED